jgi:hypothetical protein
MKQVWIHISEGTEVLAWSFDSLEDAIAFREMYADDEGPQGERKSVDDLPYLPDSYEQRDNHETDTWVLVSGKEVEAVDGIEPGHFHRVGETFVEQPLSG